MSKKDRKNPRAPRRPEVAEIDCELCEQTARDFAAVEQIHCIEQARPDNLLLLPVLWPYAGFKSPRYR